MIFHTKNHRGADDYINEIEEVMREFPYHLAGEQYLVLEMTGDGAHSYFFEVPSDGKLVSVKFNEIVPPIPWPAHDSSKPIST
jgi:hypothetical protein